MSISKTSPLIIAHRGASAVAPENTLAAFARAFDDGADGIEFDVRLARDGVPVVIHDATLRRTGRRKAAVANLLSSRLSEIDAGSWFNRRHPRFARLQYTRQTVPTLNEVFRCLVQQSQPDLIAYVEMKTTRRKSLSAALARVIVESVNRFDLQNRIIIVGFNLDAIAKVKDLEPSIRTGALFGPRQRAMKSVRKIVEDAVACGAQEILLHRLIATPRMIVHARQWNLSPVVWTVDDPSWLVRASNRHIQALVTNHPGKMRESNIGFGL